MILSKTKSLQYARLDSKKERDEQHLFLASGLKSVIDMIDYFIHEAILVADDSVLDSFQGKQLNVLKAKTEQLKKISGMQSPPEIVAVFKIPHSSEGPFCLDKNELYLFLDGIQEPGNLGTLLRTAAWFGVKNVFLSPDCADLYNRKTIQASMGVIGRLNVYRTDLLNVIKDNGNLPVIGTLLDGEDIFNALLPNHGILIMGNEGNGISQSLRELITLPVLIPPFGSGPFPDSLNVGVACGIALSVIRNPKSLN